MDINNKSIKTNFMNTSPSFPNLSSLNSYGLNINFKKQHTSKSESSDTSLDMIGAIPKGNTSDFESNLNNETNLYLKTNSLAENDLLTENKTIIANSPNEIIPDIKLITESKSGDYTTEPKLGDQVTEPKSDDQVIEPKLDDQVTETKMSFIDLLTNLKLFSHIKAYDKLTINSNIIDIDNYYFRDLFRRIRGESHVDTLNFIELMLSYADEYSNDFITNKTADNIHKLKLLTEDLDNCKIGLNNLKITYVHYNIVICKIDIYIEQINTRINKNKI